MGPVLSPRALLAARRRHERLIYHHRHHVIARRKNRSRPGVLRLPRHSRSRALARGVVRPSNCSSGGCRRRSRWRPVRGGCSLARTHSSFVPGARRSDLGWRATRRAPPLHFAAGPVGGGLRQPRHTTDFPPVQDGLAAPVTRESATHRQSCSSRGRRVLATRRVARAARRKARRDAWTRPAQSRRFSSTWRLAPYAWSSNIALGSYATWYQRRRRTVAKRVCAEYQSFRSGADRVQLYNTTGGDASVRRVDTMRTYIYAEAR